MDTQRNGGGGGDGAAQEARAPAAGQPHSKRHHPRPLILITDTNEAGEQSDADDERQDVAAAETDEEAETKERFEEIDGISYRIVAAVTRPPKSAQKHSPSSMGAKKRPLAGSHSDPVNRQQQQAFEAQPERAPAEPAGQTELRRSASAQNAPAPEQRPAPRLGRLGTSQSQRRRRQSSQVGAGQQATGSAFSSLRRKSSAFVSNLLQIRPNADDDDNNDREDGQQQRRPSQPRRMSIYEMTKSPPPETSIEHYLKERRRSSTVSAKFVQQQLEQQTTFEANYSQRQQYFRDLNAKFINQDKKLLNVVANRGQLHRHSVDIAQLPLELAQAKARSQKSAGAAGADEQQVINEQLREHEEEEEREQELGQEAAGRPQRKAIPQSAGGSQQQQQQQLQQLSATTIDQLGVASECLLPNSSSRIQLASISEDNALNEQLQLEDEAELEAGSQRSGYKAAVARQQQQQRSVIRKFQKLDPNVLSTSPAPDVKIGQRVAYKEYYGNEFGTIRWIGRVPQISSDWTAGVEFDNAIGEGDGSLNGRRYFIAKDCFAKFLPLASVALVDQHVGRPEPGTMISVMSAAVRPGQMISIQRVSTVHVQHCFLNAPHRRPYGAELLAVNTRLHCQCPNCGPCAHVVKPPRTQRLRAGKNATHMCQFSTYTCCGMRSQEEALCTYTGNKISPSPVPFSNGDSSMMHNDDSYMPLYNSWMQGSGYLTNLQAQQTKLMPEEYLRGAGPLDVVKKDSKASSRRGSGRYVHKDELENDPDEGGNQSRSRPSSRQSTEQKRHHRHHHRHRRHHHHHHHRQSSITDQMKETNDLATSDHSKLDQNHDLSTQPQHSGGVTALACPDKEKEVPYPTMNSTTTKFANSTHNEIASFPSDGMAAATTTRDLNESGLQIDHRDVGMTTKSAKVQYRDSIENRYLFPTDDPIDSTLEADLENLSQARYGSTSHGRNQSLSSTKNILRSLRSLVSCLSGATKSNCPSDFERHSENTFRFYEHPIANEINNKSPPARHVRARSCSCSSSSSGDSGRSDADDYDPGTKNLQENTSGDTSFSYNLANYRNNRKSPVEYLNSDVSSGIVDEEMNMFKPGLSSSYNFVNQSVSNYCYYSNSTPASAVKHNDNFIEKQLSLASTSSNPLASRCGCATTNTTAAASMTTATSSTLEQYRRHAHHQQRRKRRHASSSSDCGFSSASQNSISFHTSQPGCTPVDPFDAAQRCINQTYQRIVEKLISSTSAITSEDLSRLRGALSEIHSDSCCLHQQHYQEQVLQRQQQKQSPKSKDSMIGEPHPSECLFEANEECEQIIAEIIRKSLLSTGKSDDDSCGTGKSRQNNVDEACRSSSDCCRQSASPLDLSADNHDQSSPIDSDKMRVLSGSQMKIETDLSSNAILNVTDHPKDQLSLELKARSSEINDKSDGPQMSSLPKTFELKLTLSINEKPVDKSEAEPQESTNPMAADDTS